MNTIINILICEFNFTDVYLNPAFIFDLILNYKRIKNKNYY